MWEHLSPVGTVKMRLLLLLTAAISTAVSAQIAGRSETSAVNETELLGQLPTCGVWTFWNINLPPNINLTWWQLQCLFEEIPKSNCTATDLPCICTNQQLNEMITVCVAQSCTIRESLSMIARPFPRSQKILTTGSNQECDFHSLWRSHQGSQRRRLSCWSGRRRSCGCFLSSQNGDSPATIWGKLRSGWCCSDIRYCKLPAPGGCLPQNTEILIRL